MSKPEPYNIHNLPTEDPPDGYGSMMPFDKLPNYMQTVLRIQWDAETPDMKRRMRENSANWIKMGRLDHEKPGTPYKRTHVIDTLPEASAKKKGGKRDKEQHPSSLLTTIESE